MRLAQLEEMTAELSAGAKPAKQAATKAETDKPAKKEKAEKPKKAAAKKSASKKAAKGSFSVKDFYTKQIMEANAAAKAHR